MFVFLLVCFCGSGSRYSFTYGLGTSPELVGPWRHTNTTLFSVWLQGQGLLYWVVLCMHGALHAADSKNPELLILTTVKWSFNISLNSRLIFSLYSQNVAPISNKCLWICALMVRIKSGPKIHITEINHTQSFMPKYPKLETLETCTRVLACLVTNYKANIHLYNDNDKIYFVLNINTQSSHPSWNLVVILPSWSNYSGRNNRTSWRCFIFSSIE